MNSFKSTYFTFKCGNWTEGHGSYSMNGCRAYPKVIKEEIIKKLEENGEQNCSLIFHRFDTIDTDMSDEYFNKRLHPRSSFEYHIDSRWYSHVAKFIPGLVPMVAPMIAKNILGGDFGDDNSSSLSENSSSGFFNESE